MGKAEVGTPKWIGNKMKSKGLQKLRWYCQMCQKQCRDENGFKCHTRFVFNERKVEPELMLFIVFTVLNPIRGNFYCLLTIPANILTSFPMNLKKTF